ncbi:5'-_3' exoribonuclease, putative [Ricinus communis]|uniref:5'->3' exoribonuclease, putative n=1 Tax=Ricinus communis TaxID=3988 RepID=B9S1X3_RICCO|nr:5'->3' exoribonuclease, putative [Ricinus communis]
MGIPSFYKWLTEKYPDTVVDVIEARRRMGNGVLLPINTALPNPNGIEFDNLYLDMNGIIHPCFHPSDLPPPKTYEEVFRNVFMYIDKIFSMVRPRKLLFLGIDGVAPRAKMNQQRSRRFRAAKEAEKEALKMKQFIELEGENSTSLKEPAVLDSNVITPGTEFMDLLSSALRYYIRLRVNRDSGWRGIKVILSDSNVPGEGEHKIMSYIRLQRDLPGYDPNTRHCLYGLDADLIMLALATHEVHFTILREVCAQKHSSKRGKKHKFVWNPQKKANSKKKKWMPVKTLEEYVSRLNFKFLYIWALREHLEYDMRIPNLALQTDLERLIDDFIFMCLFVGNDFLPHIPTLEISQGAIDLLMKVYRKEFRRMGGYLTNSFELDLTRVEHFIQAVGLHDDAIFRQHIQKLKEKSARKEERSSKRKLEKLLQNDPHAESISGGSSLLMEKAGGMNFDEPIHHLSAGIDTGDKEEDDWKERYYAKKFKAKTKDEQESIRRDVVIKYMEGLCWVMRYYYEGVCSWQWFYPYHYAPFASDFYGLDDLKIQFTLGVPFKPMDQLMGVLPAASAHALPMLYRKLMTDESSPILDFYPSDFELDMNGKRRKWQAICKLPFIDESRLLSEITKVEHTLTDDERRRNSLGSNFLFVHISHPLADMIIYFFKQNRDPNVLLKIDPELSGGMNGFVYISDNAVCPEEVSSPVDGMRMIAHNRVISVSYRYPLFHYHISRLPQGVILPGKDISPLLQHEKVVPAGVSSRRPIPRSVSGTHLANLAHRLVSSCTPIKQDDNLGYKGPNILVDTCNWGGISTTLNSRKRKRSRNKKITIDDGYEGSRMREGECIPQNLKQCIPLEHTDGNCNPCAVKERKAEIRSAKRKRRKQRMKLKKIKEGEGFGVLDKNVVQMKHCIHRQGAGNNSENMCSCINIERLENCFISGKKQGDDAHAGAPGILEIETQVKSKKRKRMSGKSKQIDIDDSHASKGQIGSAAGFLESTSAFPSNNVQKVENSGRMEQQVDGNIEKQSNLSGAENGSLEKLGNGFYKKQGEGCVFHMGTNELGKQAQIKPKRKKRRSKGRTVLNNNLEKLASGCLSMMSNHVGANELEDMGTDKLEKQAQIKPKRKKRRSKGGCVLTNNLEKLESGGLSKQVEHDGNQVGANELMDMGTNEAQIKPKRKKRKLKGRSLLNNNVEKLNLEKLESGSLSKQAEHEGNHVVANELVHMGTNELKKQARLKSKRKKQRLKQRLKRKNNLHNNLEKLKAGDLSNQAGYDDNHDGNRVGDSDFVVQSEGKREGEFDGVPKTLEKVGSNAVEKQRGGDDHAGLGANELVHIDINELEKEAQIKPKRKRRRLKRKNDLHNNLEKLKAGDLSNQAGYDDNHDGNCVGESDFVVQSEGKREGEFDSVPKTLEKVGSNAVGKQLGGDDHAGLGANELVHIGTNELEKEAQMKTKRKKQRLKHKNNLHNNLEKLKAGDLSKQAGYDDNHDSNRVGESDIVVQSEGKREGEFDRVPKTPEKVGSNVVGKQLGGDDHAGLGAAAEMNPVKGEGLTKIVTP